MYDYSVTFKDQHLGCLMVRHGATMFECWRFRDRRFSLNGALAGSSQLVGMLSINSWGIPPGSSQLWMRWVDPDPEDRADKKYVGCVGRCILRLLEVDQSG